jgi:dipeptidyl-peptidase-4
MASAIPSRWRFAVVALLFLTTGPAAQAQDKQKADPFDPAHQAKAGRLTIDRIFASGEFRAESYGPVQWLAKQPGYSLLEPSAQVKGAQDIVRIDPGTGQREVLVSAGNLIPKGETRPLTIDGYQWSANEALVLLYTNSKRVWRKNTRGDYWVFDTGSRELKKLGGNARTATLMHARFSPDNRSVAYVLENNLVVEDLQSPRLRFVTDSGSATVINGTFDWVYEEEFYLYDGFRWSPDGKRIAFWQLNTNGVDDYYLLDNINGLYQNLTKFKYPKAGRPNAACRVGVVTVDGSASTAPVWINVPGDPAKHYIARMDWVDADTVLLQQFNRLQNTNQLFLGSPKTALAQPTLTEKDKAWVDAHDHLHWVNGGKQFTWLSERDGWRRVYLAARSGDALKPITPAGMDVINVAAVLDISGWLYFYASPKNPAQRYLWRARFDGTDAQQVTPAAQPGWHKYDIAPDGRFAIHTHSTADTPPVVSLVSLPDHQVIRPLVENKQLHDKLRTLKLRPTEFFRVPVADGVELDGWVLKPPDFDPAKKYPVVFHVYGEPAGQTVLDGWGGGMYLWHQLLAQEGYLVMSVDNRGTPAPRGREWRKCIYRQVGILAPQDQAEAVKAIQKRWSFVDPTRVGIWGWSGGGSMSLNAIFRYPDLYHTAMAVAPVPNQRYYDTIYQERYMGLPEDNPAGYRDGSALTHAHKLKGNLLLVHGTADDNVHYAGTEALVDELIAHNKHFTMMAYPNRSHSLSEGRNTLRHMFGLLTRYLHQNLPAGGR